MLISVTNLFFFLSGRFNMAQLCWSVVEKKSFPVIETLDKMHWIVADPHIFDFHTGHKNLIYILYLMYVVRDISQTIVRKVL